MSHPNTEMTDTDASKKRKKNPGVRATVEQVAVLRAAYDAGDLISAEECERLSSETGLTPPWIRSWFVRHRKKVRDEAARQPKEGEASEDDVPPKKRARTRKEPSATLARLTTLDNEGSAAGPGIPPLVSASTTMTVDDEGCAVDEVQRTEMHVGREAKQPVGDASTSNGDQARMHPVGRRPQGIEASSANPPPRSSKLPPPDNSYLPPSKPAKPPAHAPAPTAENSFASSSVSVQLKPVRNPLVPQMPSHGYVYHGSSSTDPRYLPHPVPTRNPEQQRPSRSNPQPSATAYYQKPYSSGPMLLPRPSENISPAPQPVYSQVHDHPINTWGINPTSNPPTYVSTVTPNALFVPFTPASHALGMASASSHPSSNMAVTPAAVLRTTPFLRNQQTPYQTTPSTVLLKTPILQSPFESPFSKEQSQHTNPMISPSALRFYMPEHDFEQPDPPSTSTSFDTAIDEKVLFSSVTIRVVPRRFLR
ncbi:hypothetical protein FB451DRAFT_702687 [Mycena latifolia]|nr:hypothetical protein FB451DRAFT_702687 [Mycena latifolia]